MIKGKTIRLSEEVIRARGIRERGMSEEKEGHCRTVTG